MQRRDFLKLLMAIPLAGAYQYSATIARAYGNSQAGKSSQQPHVTYTDDGRIRVLYVRGTPYERGYQHGSLLKHEVQENLNYLYEQALKTYHGSELLVKAYNLMQPFIPQTYQDEMLGLAHGADLPLSLVQHVHALPSITEWRGTRHYLGGSTCTNIGLSKSATQDGKTYAVRVLDWGLHRISNMHKYPLITICIPDTGIPHANIGWIGGLGAVSGMNAQGITIGERGNGAPNNETLAGKPMPFLLRDVLTFASSLADVRRLLKESPGDNAFIFVMSDGKTQEAELYAKDPDNFFIFKAGEALNADLKGFKDIVYSSDDNPTLETLLSQTHGRLTPELLMNQIIPNVAMPANFQNVIYDPAALRFWVNNAPSSSERAADQPYTTFDFGAALKGFQ